MARNETIRIKGLKEFLHATDRAGKQTKKLVRDDLRQAVEPVRAEAASRLSTLSAKSAGHLGITVRASGHITVEQRLRKVTGRRPDWGATQMKYALLPALAAKEGEVEARLERAVDLIADRFEGGASV